jgi:uncharacterized protein YneF (UPF0154 family)
MKISKILIYFLLLFSGIIIGIFICHKLESWSLNKEKGNEPQIKFDDKRKVEWPTEFKVVEIISKIDNNRQKAYFYRANSNKTKPLVVSLHTWSGYYDQPDPLAELCRSKDLNYIHPDFRGANFTEDACCSDLALSDIDEAITYAIKNSNVDIDKIYVIGVSGGGYATLSTFMKSKHKIKKFSAWASISDINSWYNESRIRNNNYDENILACTGSENGILNVHIAEQRSPVCWKTPVSKIINSDLYIYAGVYDGIQGSVPITHSINFYNKILSDLKVTDSSLYVTDKEKLQLLEYRVPLGDFGQISGRDICLIKKFKNIKLTVFTGNHEMLPEYAFNELLNQ